MFVSRYDTHKLLTKKQIKRLMKKYKPPLNLYLVLENIQYARNVASIFRIADAMRVKKIYLTGISHTPPFGKELTKVSRHKEKSVPWEYVKDTPKVLNYLKKHNITPVAIELTNMAVPFYEFEYPTDLALVVGNENYGITRKTLQYIHHAVFIPMFGKGASLNVHVSLAIVGFHALISSLPRD